MTFDDYQEDAVKTAIYGEGDLILYPTLGLVNEAGEVAGKVKKVLRDNDGEFDEERVNALADEIGDVLWYMAALARDIGWTLDSIAQKNLAKLKDRQERGVIKGSGDTR